jgi:monoamine oxidase
MTTIVIGAGLAGLSVAEALASKGDKVFLLEKYGALGGRVATMHRKAEGKVPALQYEIGAGRVFWNHKRVLKLIREMGLHTYAISMGGTTWRGRSTGYTSEPNSFSEVFSPLAERLLCLPRSTLATTTIEDLLKKVAPPELQRSLTIKYPYWSEIKVMRADLALESFVKDATMAVTDDVSFLGVTEGLDSITDGLAERAKKAGVTILTHHTVSDVKGYTVVGTKGKKGEELPFSMTADRVVIATCRCTAGSFPSLKSLPLFKHLDTEALIRIYAVYPKVDGKVWFSGMGKVVTDSPLRYVIPINEEKGLIMISYTDGEDCEEWRGMTEKQLERKIAKEVHAVFGKVPAPIYLKAHDWGKGCTYWKPGSYDPVKMGELALQPFSKYPHLHLCGESYSMQQTWMEGALESAEALLKKIL